MKLLNGSREAVMSAAANEGDASRSDRQKPLLYYALLFRSRLLGPDSEPITQEEATRDMIKLRHFILFESRDNAKNAAEWHSYAKQNPQDEVARFVENWSLV